MLWVLLACWLIYDKGLADGGRVLLSVGYLVSLLCVGVSIAMGLLLRQPLLAGSARYLVVVIAAYPLVALALGWRELLFLSLVGSVGGLFVGAVVALFSREGRR